MYRSDAPAVTYEKNEIVFRNADLPDSVRRRELACIWAGTTRFRTQMYLVLTGMVAVRGIAWANDVRAWHVLQSGSILLSDA